MTEGREADIWTYVRFQQTFTADIETNVRMGRAPATDP